MNKDIDRIKSWRPCNEELSWFEKQNSLEESWDKCEEPSWLFFICKAEPKLKLKKKQSVAIAIAFANSVLAKFEVAYPDNKRPRKAIEAAQAWLDDPTEENADTAHAAADDAAYADYAARGAANAALAAAANAAYAAAYVASYAAYSALAAAHHAESAAVNVATYDYAAFAAARADATGTGTAAAERKAQADIIRLIVPNPFK